MRGTARIILKNAATAVPTVSARTEKSKFLDPLQNRVNSLLADVEAEASSIKDARQRKKEREERRAQKASKLELSKSLPNGISDATSTEDCFHESGTKLREVSGSTGRALRGRRPPE